MADFTATPTDTVGVTDALARHLAFSRSLSDTVGITETLRTHVQINLPDTVGIAGSLVPSSTLSLSFFNDVDITDDLNITGSLIQFDSWRPVPKPDNSLVLICRTPVGEHDSYTGQTHISLWTIVPDGTGEKHAVLTPAENGWTSYAHPEWSPDGDDVIIAVETVSEYELVVVDATGFGE